MCSKGWMSFIHADDGDDVVGGDDDVGGDDGGDDDIIIIDCFTYCVFVTIKHVDLTYNGSFWTLYIFTVSNRKKHRESMKISCKRWNMAHRNRWFSQRTKPPCMVGIFPVRYVK